MTADGIDKSLVSFTFVFAPVRVSARYNSISGSGLALGRRRSAATFGGNKSAAIESAVSKRPFVRQSSA